MTLADWIVVAVIVLIIGSVIGYIIHSKKNGAKCIGCPDSKNCSGHNHCRGNGRKPF